MHIRKAVITVTMIYDDRDEPSPADMSLYEIASAIDNGNAVGQRTAYFDVALDPEVVPTELKALGNDGEFFG